MTDPGNFFDIDSGIYVFGNEADTTEYPYWGSNFWEDWERPIHVEFYEPDGELGFNVDAGVKIFGSWSRLFPQKSLAIFARGRYGYDEINYQIFPDISINSFQAFVLRNSGQDWGHTFFRDAMMQSLTAEATNVDVQAYRPAMVMLNGEIWGIHNIREKFNEHYIALSNYFGRQIRIFKTPCPQNSCSLHMNGISIWNRCAGRHRTVKSIISFHTLCR